MRVIKFRAWDSENKKYHKPVYNATENQLEELLINQNGRLAMWCMEGLKDESLLPNRFTIEQFTGLTDKNGKEIYEGDILKTKTGIASVIWCDASFALLSPGSEAVDWEHSSVYEKSEVIGNIHENSDLL